LDLLFSVINKLKHNRIGYVTIINYKLNQNLNYEKDQFSYWNGFFGPEFPKRYSSNNRYQSR